jgi:transcriptional regulator with XRE-family HTH domain
MERRRKNIAYGRHEGLVSNKNVANHVTVLRASGWTVREIANQARVSHNTVNRAALGTAGKIRAESARRILEVHPNRRPDPTLGGQLVDSTGTRRRLQALVTMGYPGAELLRMIGANEAYVTRMMTFPLVTVTTRDRVRELYDDLWDTPPVPTDQHHAYQIRRARKRALRNGWVPPLAWDDDAIDDPDATPDFDCVVVPIAQSNTRLSQDVVDAAVYGDRPSMTPVERREAVRVLNERRWSARQIADHIGCSARTIDRIRKELDLPIYLVTRDVYREVA